MKSHQYLHWTDAGEVQLWDVQQCKRLRLLRGLDSRVASLAWNKWVLTAGCRTGQLQHSDVRVADHCLSRVQVF